MLSVIALSGLFLCVCGGGSGGSTSSSGGPAPAAAPTISTTAAQSGAVIAALKTTTSGATIYYTLDSSTPTASSQVYEAPILVAANLTVKAIATAQGNSMSPVASQTFTPNIPSGTLVWAEEFDKPGQPNPSLWTYDAGNSGFGNNEQENYCVWGSNASPCSAANPNAQVEADGLLHIVARQPSAGVYTSARLKSQGLFSFMYGRIEARLKLPESQGMWPAFWLLGNNIATIGWPASGELDIMEHIDGSNPPLHVGGAAPGYDWAQSTIHGTGLATGTPYHSQGFSAAGWHTYGMTWSKGKVQFYIDDHANPYLTFTPGTGTWPFDQGPQFILLNLAVGGDWPGNVDNTTVFPSEMLVDYVRIYTN
jgi:beta-glucanase (GH16 family)